MTKTLNVRCCCTPGLVLGRLPDLDPGTNVWTWPLYGGRWSFLTLRKQVAFMIRDDVRYDDLSWNSNHSDGDTLARIADFEPVCNIPAGHPAALGTPS